MARYYIKNGVELECDKGSATSNLTVTSTTNTKIKGENWATEKDKEFGTNFKPFGTCSCNSGAPCVAKTIKWINIAENESSSGKKYILHDSKLLCSLGGAITIKLEEKGNTSDAEDPKVPKESNEGSTSNSSSSPSNDDSSSPESATQTNHDSSDQTEDKENSEDSKKTYTTTRRGKKINLLVDPKKYNQEEGVKNNRTRTRARGPWRNNKNDNSFQDSVGQEALNILGDIGRNLVNGRSLKVFGNYVVGVGKGIKGAVVGLYTGAETAFLYGRNRTELYLSSLSEEERFNQEMANLLQDQQISQYIEGLPGNYDELRLFMTDKFEEIGISIEEFKNLSEEEQGKLIGQGVGGFVGGGAVGAAAKKGTGAMGKAMKAFNIGANPKGYLTNLFKSKAIENIPGGPEMMALYNKVNQAKNYKNGLKELKKIAAAPLGLVLNKKARKKTQEEIDAEENRAREAHKKAQKEKDKLEATLLNQRLEKLRNQEKAEGKTKEAASALVQLQKRSDPVDVVTGVVIYDDIDFEIPGIIPIRWERYWYSDSKYIGPLGHGCHHKYDIHIQVKEKLILLTLSDGRPAFFPILTKENNSSYNAKEKLTLTLTNNQNYELFDHTAQLNYTFENRSNIYRLTQLSNVKGIAIEFQYYNDHLDKIIDTAGRVIKIHSNEKGFITKITAHHKENNRTLVRYNYNKMGDMIKITDPQEKSVTIIYKNHLMVSKTHRLGKTFNWEYEKMKPGARCTRAWGDNGLLEYTIEYGKEYNRVINSLGHTSLFYHQGGNLATKIVDPLGGVIIRMLNKNNDVVKLIDEEGNEINYKYDERGNLSEKKLSDGSTVEYTFDKKNKLQLLTKPEGGVVVRSYKNDQLDCIIEPDGMMTTFEYNKEGLISKIYDNRDKETLLFYDNEYNLIKTQFPDGSISTWEYDCWGQCIKTVNPVKQQQEFSYDVLGNISKIRLPDNTTVKLEYDSYGRIIKAIDNKQIINYQYTLMGNLKSREQDGRRVLFRYNNEEELIGIINEQNESYSFTRDAKGNIIEEKGFDNLTRKFIRDKAGKVIKVERPDNNHSIYKYDKGGRISRIDYKDGTWATYSYNKDGLLTEAVNQNSHVKFTRDQAGRILSENQDGYTVTSEYGELGIRTAIKSNLGADINFEHSIMGEVNKVLAKTDQVKPWEANFLYNSLGMETERILPGGITSSWNYDRYGNPKQHIVRSKNREQRNRTYAWDVNSKLKQITNNLTHKTTRFTYDVFNSLASAQYEDGSYDYKLPDEVGNLYRTKDKKNREYGKSGKLLRSGSTHYHYDKEGSLIEKDTPKGTWKYTWEAGGMLQSVTKPDKTKIEFEYDALGRRTSKIIHRVPSEAEGQNSVITRFVWDGNVPLHEWKYNLKDRPRTVVDGLGNISKDTKEPVKDVITWIFNQGTSIPSAKITYEDTYSIITDYLGTPVEMYNSNGEKTWQAEYDMYGKVRKLVTGSLNDCPFRYQGQYEDVETELYYNRFRYYSPQEGLYISQDPIRLAGNNPNIYAYTKDNNVWIDVFGLAGDYKEMPVVPGHQRHHIIPQSMNHPLLNSIGYDPHQSRNIIQLPTTTDIDPTRAVHRGKHFGDYDNMIKTRLDVIDNMDASNEIKRAHTDALMDEIRDDLENKRIILNKAK
ncbi:DUF6531 domain-containing protein [Aquimarina sp. Aq107]|uniref:DUF6531 domain-containing protein n=1 Tax=Aquimarina sp. Aq107 TaxID=1191912 RepID=UPI000D551866|nr:DUF6531 domain-containing protein [Aquimarina sp. Aq107]